MHFVVLWHVTTCRDTENYPSPQSTNVQPVFDIGPMETKTGCTFRLYFDNLLTIENTQLVPRCNLASFSLRDSDLSQCMGGGVHARPAGFPVRISATQFR